MEAITAKVGTRVTDAVLCTSDGADYKSIDEFELANVIATVMRAAERPRMATARQQLVDALTFRFNFRQRVADNVNVLRTHINRLAAYGITLNKGVIATIILAEADKAAREPWRREIETAVAKLRLRYLYAHVHDATSVAAILDELAAADSVRDHLAAPGPVTLQAQDHHAHAANNAMSHVRRLIYDSSSDEDKGTAASAAGSSSDSSRGRPSRSSCPKPRDRGERDRGSTRHRSKSRSDDFTAENNPCKHCKRHGRHNCHPGVEEARCFWNKKWKGFRPKYCCRAMDVKFKSRSNFSAKLGGYDDDTTSGEETE